MDGEETSARGTPNTVRAKIGAGSHRAAVEKVREECRREERAKPQFFISEEWLARLARGESEVHPLAIELAKHTARALLRRQASALSEVMGLNASSIATILSELAGEFGPTG
jgi:hypothetical protein